MVPHVLLLGLRKVTEIATLVYVIRFVEVEVLQDVWIDTK